eukprot:gene22806-biopygen13318
MVLNVCAAHGGAGGSGGWGPPGIKIHQILKKNMTSWACGQDALPNRDGDSPAHLAGLAPGSPRGWFFLDFLLPFRRHNGASAWPELLVPELSCRVHMLSDQQPQSGCHIRPQWGANGPEYRFFGGQMTTFCVRTAPAGPGGSAFGVRPPYEPQGTFQAPNGGSEY